jgi:hypothetical protein
MKEARDEIEVSVRATSALKWRPPKSLFVCAP